MPNLKFVVDANKPLFALEQDREKGLERLIISCCRSESQFVLRTNQLMTLIKKFPLL
jgi:hypothetical protein